MLTSEIHTASIFTSALKIFYPFLKLESDLARIRTSWSLIRTMLDHWSGGVGGSGCGDVFLRIDVIQCMSNKFSVPRILVGSRIGSLQLTLQDATAMPLIRKRRYTILDTKAHGTMLIVLFASAPHRLI